MTKTIKSSWKANLLSTVDTNYVSLKVDPVKALQLETGLKNGHQYYLTLEAGFDVEIVKVVAVIKDKLTVDRGQQNTFPGIWPAGTPIEARITAKTMDELQLNLNSLIENNEETLIAPNGDVITKLG